MTYDSMGKFASMLLIDFAMANYFEKTLFYSTATNPAKSSSNTATRVTSW